MDQSENTRFYPPTLDFIFKLLFGDERNKEILIDFLKAVLKIPHNEYDKIEISDPYLLRDYAEDKMGILDVKLILTSGRVVNIEIQVLPIAELEKRLIYYNAKMITEQLQDGEDYKVLNPVINIVITDHILLQDSPAYIHHFGFHDLENSVTLTNMSEIYTFELPKLPLSSDNTETWVWGKFISVKTREELKMISDTHPQLEKASEELLKLANDKRARMLHDAKIKRERDERARFQYALDEAVKAALDEAVEAALNEAVHAAVNEAVAETESNTSIEIAKNLLRIGRPLDEVITVTNLDKSTIQTLLGDI